MKSDDAFRVVLVTAPDLDTGRRIARTVIEARLAACVNLVPAVESIYWWKGEVQQDAEVLLVMKTTAAALDRLEAVVKQSHPYEVPEFVALSITEGSREYLRWLGDSVE